MFNKLIKGFNSLFGRSSANREGDDTGNMQPARADDNNQVQSGQLRLMAGILIVAVIGLGAGIKFVQTKVEIRKPVEKVDDLKVELADKALDGEKMWRNFHEDELNKKTTDLNERLKKAEDAAAEAQSKMTEQMQKEVFSLNTQLKLAREELLDAGKNLRDLMAREQERLNSAPMHMESIMDMQDFADHIRYDVPKSAADYIPEGTYLTGNLVGGIVVSTALNTPDENATPVLIRLTGRGNLAGENETDIKQCQIEGSAYGDLSSERAVIRLEKLICKEDGMYITSNIAGEVHGPDGLNGIKGKVVSTGTKHIKNAAIGGMISGLSNSAKGQEGMNLTGGGMLSTKSKGFKDVATGGMLSGVSNAGEKIADYYLRQAEAMSPVLIIPPMVKIQAHITKGFFMGELGTRQRIEQDRIKKSGTGRGKEAVSRPTNNNTVNSANGERNANWE